MKTALIVFLALVPAANLFAQLDKHGNPVFISQVLSEEKLDSFEMTSSYYTIADNISNKASSVYVSDAPTLDDYIKFSRDLPSNFFIIHRGPHTLMMILPMQKQQGAKKELVYFIVNPASGKQMEVPCHVDGEITEKRVAELLKLKVDTNAMLLAGKMFVFNGVAYRIQPYKELKADVRDLANQIFGAAAEDKKSDKNH